MASDDFNRPDGGLGANWTTYTNVESPIGTPTIVSHAATGVASDHSGALWVPDSFPADQASAVTLAASLTVGQFVSPNVRVASDGSSMYAALLFWPNALPDTQTVLAIYKEVGSTFTLLRQVVVGPQAPGTVVRLDVQGTQLTASLNGVALVTVADGAVTAGQPGFLLFDTASIDAWSAQTLAPVTLRTFGNNSISGASSPGADNPNQIVGTTYTLTEAGYVIRLSMYWGSAQTEARAVIYPAVDGSAPLAVTAEVPSGQPPNSWVDYVLPAPVLLQAGDYALDAWLGDVGGQLFGNATFGTGWFMNSGATYSPTGPAPNPFANSLVYTEAWCIYATYQPAVAALDALVPASVSLRM